MADNGQSKINGIKYVVNPLTNKPVKVNGRTFNSLVREGVFNQGLGSIPEKRVRPAKSIVARTQDRTQAYRMKSQLEKEKPLPPNKLYAVANDSKTIVVKNKKAPTLKPDNLVSMMSRASVEVNKRLMKDPNWSQVLSQNPDNLDAKTREHLEHLILQELISNGKQVPSVVENKKIINYNIKESNATKLQKPARRFIVSQQLPTNSTQHLPTQLSRGNTQRPPARRSKPQSVFSDTDQLTTDAYTTNADDDEEDYDDEDDGDFA